jgi:hypothetical protein
MQKADVIHMNNRCNATHLLQLLELLLKLLLLLQQGLGFLQRF